jgi:hypothetical protein
VILSTVACVSVEYKKGEDPHLKMTGKYQQAGAHSLIALSPNAEVVVIATGNSLAFYSALTGHHDYTIDNIYSGKGQPRDLSVYVQLITLQEELRRFCSTPWENIS